MHFLLWFCNNHITFLKPLSSCSFPHSIPYYYIWNFLNSNFYSPPPFRREIKMELDYIESAPRINFEYFLMHSQIYTVKIKTVGLPSFRIKIHFLFHFFITSGSALNLFKYQICNFVHSTKSINNPFFTESVTNHHPDHLFPNLVSLAPVTTQ